MNDQRHGRVQPNYRVVTVDDSPAISIVLQAIFDQLGIKNITSYDDAQKAFNDIEKSPCLFDLILTDLNMPGMDGMEFIRRLGKIKYDGVVVIVSEMQPEVINLASKLARQHNVHLLGNITKPVQLKDVQHLLRRLDCLCSFDDDPLANISELSLLDAISHNRVTPLYQPKVFVSSGKIRSLEVMSHIVPRTSMMQNDEGYFVGVARSNELLNLLTFQLIEKSAKDLAHFRKAYGQDLKLAINLHPTQLADLNCPDKFSLILSLNNLRPSDVLIEISEHQPLNDNHVLETINRLKMRGFELSLDDYGSGFTEGQQLYNLPIDEIKVCEPLITEIEQDYFAQSVLHGLDDISNDRGLNLVAVGVSRVEELDYLRSKFPAMIAQGSLICPALKRDEMFNWLEQRQRQKQLS